MIMILPVRPDPEGRRERREIKEEGKEKMIIILPVRPDPSQTRT